MQSGLPLIAYSFELPRTVTGEPSAMKADAGLAERLSTNGAP
jgi:hypothetical protein